MVRFAVHFFTKPEDKRLELEKQAMTYQIDQTTVNVNEKLTDQPKKSNY